MCKHNPLQKRLLAVLLLLALLLSAAFSHAESAPDYYKIGLEAAGVLDEMLQSPFYQKFILSSPDFISAVSGQNIQQLKDMIFSKLTEDD